MKRLLVILSVLSIFACGGNKQIDVAGFSPSPFVGKRAWEKNGPWQDFSISIAAKGDSLLLVAGGVFLGGSRIQMPDWGNDGTPLPEDFQNLCH